MKKNIQLHATDPGISAIAAGNETKASVIPLRTTFESSVFDRFAMKPRTQNTERPPYNDVRELTKEIHQELHMNVLYM